MPPVELAPGFFVSPQIAPADVAAAKARGVTLIVNNRPEGEEPGQPKGADIAEAASRAGLAYVAIPVGPTGVSEAHLDALDEALKANQGAVLAFCKSGTRSTIVRAFAQARAGRSPRQLIEEAAAAGFNITGAASKLETLAKAPRNQ
ncbi:MAG: TIGR01244 family sulfur transferase [Parvularculaceae bacterium]